jgi:hypothetical protein
MRMVIGGALCLLLATPGVFAQSAVEARIRPTDTLGRVQHGQPSFELRNGQLRQVDSLGRRTGEQYVVKENRIYQTDQLGRPQYGKPIHEVRKDGRIRAVDHLGRRLLDQQEYVVKGDRVMPVDAYGRVQANRPGYKIERKQTGAQAR